MTKKENAGSESDLSAGVRPLCPGCNQEIDPDVCCCGALMEEHGRLDWHIPVPMGCMCGYAKNKNRA